MSRMTNNTSASQFSGDIIGIDIGAARIGVARIHPIVKLSEPLHPILVADGNPYEAIQRRLEAHEAEAVIFGLPRSLNGDSTEQTRAAEKFVLEFVREIPPTLPMYFIDEAGTSIAADARINGNTAISRDSMSACIMLEDFVQLKDISPLLINPLN
jgi:putative transcription antitermination factor YqgF